jgi:hypothetical protein
MSLIISFLLFSCELNGPETTIQKIHSLTKAEGNSISEIYVITNPPLDSLRMIELLDEFHIKNGKLNQYDFHDRMYIRPSKLKLDSHELYDNNGNHIESTEDLRNEDFLASYFWYRSQNGKTRCRKTLYIERW